MKEIVGTYKPEMKLADLHIHTTGSDGHMTPEQVVELAVSLGHLSTIAITDHNTIAPSYEAKNYAAKQGYHVNVITGVEINTQSGHFLGLDIYEDVPRDLSLIRTIKEIHKQKGLAIAAHPFLPRLMTGKFSLDESDFIEVLNHPDEDVYLDAIEVFNAGVDDNPRLKGNEKAILFYASYPDKFGGATGGTDAHYYTVGRAVTAYSGDVLQSIREKNTAVLVLDQSEQLEIVNFAIKMFGEENVLRYNKVQKKSDPLF